MSKRTKNSNLPALPPDNTTRWVKSRKMAVIKAIDAGVLSDDEACAKYSLSLEELASWRRLAQTHGPDALRTTHLKRYRSADLREQNFHIEREPAGRPQA